MSRGNGGSIDSRLADAARGSADAAYELGMVYSSGAAGIDVDLIDRGAAQRTGERSVPADEALARIGLVIPDKGQGAVVVVLVRDGCGRAEPDAATVFLAGRVDRSALFRG